MSIEQTLTEWLRPVLADLPDGAAIPDSDTFPKVVNALAWFVPTVLAEIHPQWRGLTLDGIEPVSASRPHPNELKLFGVCCFLADQTLTPIHIRLRLAGNEPAIEWFECRVGELRNGALVRAPYSMLRQMKRRIQHLGWAAEELDWAWQVHIGQ